jgi:hypothetical protein
MKLAATIFVLGFVCGVVTPAHAASASKPVRVLVDCSSNNDSVGARFCLALREKIRASQGFELVDSEKPLVFEVHIVSESDTAQSEPQDVSCAAAVVFTAMSVDSREIYLTSFVLDFGANRVGEEAEQVLAHIDQESDFLHKIK